MMRKLFQVERVAAVSTGVNLAYFAPPAQLPPRPAHAAVPTRRSPLLHFLINTMRQFAAYRSAVIIPILAQELVFHAKL